MANKPNHAEAAEWFQLEVAITCENADYTSELLQELGACAVTLVNASQIPLYEPLPEATPLWDKIWVCGLFAAETEPLEIIAKLLKHIAVLDYRIQSIDGQNWMNAWKNHFHPLQFGRLWIGPRDEVSKSPQDSNIVRVVLDPGLAFGTGTHPTTALCLDWLAHHLKPQTKVLDYGCGSGILAISAYKLGASEVWAVDHDRQALTATRANARQNQVPVEAFNCCLPKELPEQEFDVILANILANPLIELAPKLITYLKPQGYLILSGILNEQAASVVKAYADSLIFEPLTLKEEWIRAIGRKKSKKS